MPRASRLRTAAEFDAVRRAGYKGRDALFIVNAAPHAGVARLGIAVSRRVSGKAVTRNRIKRQIRESFRLHQTMLRGFDIFIVAQSRAAQAVNAELARSLRGHWNRLTRR